MTGPQAYHPIARQLTAARHLQLEDSARLMAAFAVGMTDAYIAVFDAKYHNEFWRPITAIRNGDIDGNSATEIDPSWQPLDSTPMHPEYPCAHCILSGTPAALIESFGGLQDVSEISLTSPTAPGITHHWSSLDAFTTEVANARVWAAKLGSMFSPISHRSITIRQTCLARVADPLFRDSLAIGRSSIPIPPISAIWLRHDVTHKQRERCQEKNTHQDVGVSMIFAYPKWISLNVDSLNDLPPRADRIGICTCRLP
jgi:hypothetical protein